MQISYSPGLALLLLLRAVECNARSVLFSVQQQTPLDKAEAQTAPPATLAAYCAQSDSPSGKGGFVVGQPVEANWLEFGVYYRGHITGINPDGTYNVHYEDDDMRERGVKMDAIRPRKVGPKNLDPSKDPACTLKNDVDDLNKDIGKAQEEVARWLSERRKKREGRSDTEASTTVDDSEAASPSSQSTNSHEDVASKTSGGHIGSQDEELDKVVECVYDVDEELKVIKAKQVELEKKGDLDPELQTAIAGASKQHSVVKGEVESLKQAVAEEKEAHKKLQAVAKHVTKKLRDKAIGHAQAVKDKMEAFKAVIKADEKVQQKVENVQLGLRDVRSSAKKFDTSVTPNASKWWRYRYEYSCVEAGILLCIVPLMAFYKYIFSQYRLRLMGKEGASFFGSILQDIKTMHLAWLHFMAAEMLVNFFVVSTIWLFATFGCFDFLVLHIHDDNIHLPTAAEHYRVMAVSISIQLGLACLAYHGLSHSVVKATIAKFKRWKGHEDSMDSARFSDSSSTNTSARTSMNAASMASVHLSSIRNPTLLPGPFEFKQLQDYFSEAMEKSWPQVQEQLEEIQELSQQHPLLEYLNIAVRKYTEHILELRTIFWLYAWCTFLIFMLLHRFAHVSYIRIMSFFVILLLINLIGMYIRVAAMSSRLNKYIENEDDDAKSGSEKDNADDTNKESSKADDGKSGGKPSEGAKDGKEKRRLSLDVNAADAEEAELEREESLRGRQPSQYMSVDHKESVHAVLHADTAAGQVIGCSQLLQFTLFFLCYGFVRMATAPWLWHIYFFNVLILTIVFLLVAMFFVFKVADLLPVFYAAMSFPPNIPEADATIIVNAMWTQHKNERRKILRALSTPSGFNAERRGSRASA